MAKEKKEAIEQQRKKSNANTQTEIKRAGSQLAIQNKRKTKLLKMNWLNFLDEEHADAVICDSFWYVICKICNPQPMFE